MLPAHNIKFEDFPVQARIGAVQVGDRAIVGAEADRRRCRVAGEWVLNDFRNGEVKFGFGFWHLDSVVGSELLFLEIVLITMILHLKIEFIDYLRISLCFFVCLTFLGQDDYGDD